MISHQFINEGKYTDTDSIDVNCLLLGYSWKYIGLILEEHLDFKMCLSALAQSGTKGLEALMHKIKSVDLSHNIFTTLYN